MSMHSIRVRLTAWYALVMALAFLAAGAVTYAVARRQIQRSSDAATVSTTHNFISALRDEMEEGRGRLTLRSANELLTEFRDDERAIVILDARGDEVAAQATPLAASLDRALLRRRAAARQFGLTTLNGGATRLYLAPAAFGAQSFVVAAAQSRARQRETLRDLRNAMLATAPVALLVACAGGYLLARKSLAPVMRMSEKARAISATNLSERIEVVNPRDELGELASTLNDLLTRLDRSFADQRRFMADASHELRTPVAILQGELDVTLSRNDRDVTDYRESLEVMHRSVRRLTRIVRDLFLLARSDAGDLPLKREPVYAGDVVSQTVRAYRTVAAERGITLAVDCDTDLLINGDEDLLQRMIGNLVENAIRHTPRGADVRVHCGADGELARIEVRDTGSGVPEECREQIFERFYRADPVRTAREGSGAGLGLPIARRIAEVHGGALRLERSGEDGSVFAVTLPLRRAASASSRG
jgi:heavy metal sensor kinase